MTWTKADLIYMSHALQLAGRGLYTTHPNPRVGCVLVKDDQIIAEGWHEYTGGPHAEVNALNNAKGDVSGSICYVTLEPCSHTGRTSPCADTLVEAGIKKVITAMLDPNPEVCGQGMQKLEQAGIETSVGLLTAESERINEGYIMRRTEKRPLVRCKLAMSLDGRTALANSESKWITGPEARLDVQRLRARSSAIMTGIGTVLADDPGLYVREIELDAQPLRVIIDPQLKFPLSSKMLQLPGRTLIFTNNSDNAIHELLEQAGAGIVLIDNKKDGFLKRVLTYLAITEEINEVLLETGSTLAGSMLIDGLIDELIIYQAPILMGDSAKGLFHLPGINTMADTIELELIDTRKVGRDIRITAKVISHKS